jgi:general secretion pathway protein I
MNSRIGSTLKGFTLIEVMVALAIFTVVSVTLIQTSTLSVRQTGLIQDRSTGWWLAENEMTRLRLLERTDENFPRTGTDRSLVELPDSSWEIETLVESTENDYVRRVTIAVYKNDQQSPAAQLVGFIGRY